MSADNNDHPLVYRTTCQYCGFDSGVSPHRVVHTCRRKAEADFKKAEKMWRRWMPFMKGPEDMKRIIEKQKGRSEP